MASERPLNVAVVGYGMSATIFHIPFIKHNPSLNLHTIVQRSPSSSSSAAPRDHPAARHHTSLDPALADPEVDLVVVTTPPNTHLAMARAALDASKHVLVEKPFVPTAAQAAELDGLARSKGLVLCVFHNRRFDSDFLAVRDLLRSDALGRLVDFETHFDRFRPRRPETWKGTLAVEDAGGPLYDLGTHLVDQVYALFGMPRSVFGRLVCAREDRPSTTDFDSLTAILAYPGSLTVQVRASIFSARRNQLRYLLRGTRGSFVKHGLDPQEDQLKAGQMPGTDGFGEEAPDMSGVKTTVGQGGEFEESVLVAAPKTYAAFYEQLVRAVRAGDGEMVPVKASEARDVLRIIEGILESAKTGRLVEIKV